MPAAALAPTLPEAAGEILPGLAELIAEELAPKVVDIDLKGVYPETFLRKLGTLGGLGSLTPVAQGGAALGMHGIGQGLQLGQDLGAQPDLGLEGAPDVADRAVGHGGEPYPTGRHGPVVVQQRLAGRVPVDHAFVGAGTDEAVAQRDGAEGKGLKEHFGIGHGRWARERFGSGQAAWLTRARSSFLATLLEAFTGSASKKRT